MKLLIPSIIEEGNLVLIMSEAHINKCKSFMDSCALSGNCKAIKSKDVSVWMVKALK